MNLSADGTQMMDDARHDLPVALDHYSIEIGVNESDALAQQAQQMPKDTQIFLNMLPNDQIDDRIRICQQIHSLGKSAVPHIAARLVGKKSDVPELLDRYVQEGGVRDFLVIAGDCNRASGEVEDALDLLASIGTRDFGIRSIGIAGYPDGHPQISDDILDKALQDKVAVLQALDIEPVVVTQFSFNADAIVEWCEKIHARYPDVVIKVGVPGPAKLTTLIRFSQRCGVVSSMKKLKGLPIASSLKLMQRVPPLNQTLAVGNYRNNRNSNVRIHFFTFGGLEASLEWIQSEQSETSPNR